MDRCLRRSFPVLVAVLLLAAPLAAASAPDVAALLRAAKVEFQQDEDGLIEVYYRLQDGRTQSVMVQEMEPLREVPLLEIYSPVFRLESGRLDAEQGRRLLELNGQQKIGYYGIEAVGEVWWVIAYHNLPADRLTAATLAVVLDTVAVLADAAERQLGGPSADEN